MKKLFFTALIAVSVSFGSSAQDVNQFDQKAVYNFKSSFAGASHVEWSSKENFTIASFLQDDHKVEVFYNTDGDFVAASNQVGMEQLPSYFKKVVEKKYSNYTVKEAFKLNGNDEIAYFIFAENDEDKIVLKAKQGSVSLYSKKAKI